MSVTFADIRAMLKDRPAIEWGYAAEFDAIAKDLAQQVVFSAEDKAAIKQMARLQNKIWPVITHPRAALYASAYHAQTDETIRLVKKLASGDHPITRLCSVSNADLRVYELDLEGIAPKDGMDEETAAHAISYGLMALDEHVDFLVIGTLSAGAQNAAQKIHDACVAQKEGDALKALARYAGHDLCALFGSVLAARMAKIPVLCSADLHPFLSAISQALMAADESVLLPFLPGGMDHLAGMLYHLARFKALVAMGPQPVKNLTNIAKAA